MNTSAGRSGAVIGAILCLTPLVPADTRWAKSYGGTSDDVGLAISQIADGGFVVAGYAIRQGDPDDDLWLARINPSGGVKWQRYYDVGAWDDIANDVQPTVDGGYIVAGVTTNYRAGDSYENKDFLVIKTDARGVVTWWRAYGGNYFDSARAVHQTRDGGYIVIGSSASSLNGSTDVSVLKLDSAGGIEWWKTYGGWTSDDGKDVVITSDSGYLVAADTKSFGSGQSDVWLLKLKSTGAVAWQKAYGGSQLDLGMRIVPSVDGNYLLAGLTASFGAGLYDGWIVKVDSNGVIVWQKAYGTIDNNAFLGIAASSDGGAVPVGYTYLPSGRSYLGQQIWGMKIDSTGVVIWQNAYGGGLNDSAYQAAGMSKGGFAITGSTRSYGNGNTDAILLKLDPAGEIGASCTNASPPFYQSVESTVTTTKAKVKTTKATVKNMNATITDVEGETGKRKGSTTFTICSGTSRRR
ncbi:MAG: hypothetical protein HYX75_03485 [Acidobacteria bacterium]|nr:hypothetical protein [Acidobacteriota bacterium]